MICVATTFKSGDVILPENGVLEAYSNLGDVYCTSNLYSENTENYGIVKSIFKFDCDGKHFSLAKSTTEDPNPTCETYGNACKYDKDRTPTHNTKETTS